MDIKTALIKLTGLFDCLSKSGCLTDEEYEIMNEVENTITAYVKENKIKSNKRIIIDFLINLLYNIYIR